MFGILVALGLVGGGYWWWNHNKHSSSTAAATTDNKPLKAKPVVPGESIPTTGPTESYTRAEFAGVLDKLAADPQVREFYVAPTSTVQQETEHALSVWDATAGTTEDRIGMAAGFRAGAHDARLTDTTRALFERASRMMRFSAISNDKVDPRKTMGEIDTTFSGIDATGKPLSSSLGSGGAYEGITDTIKTGTYTRERFAQQVDELLASPEISKELTSTDMGTGVTINQAPTVKANSLKIWDEGPTSARAAFAIDDYAAGRGVEPQADASNTTVVWVKSGTATSKTDPFSPAVAQRLVDLAMMMRWRAVSESSSQVDADNTRAAIDEVFSRIDLAAAGG